MIKRVPNSRSMRVPEDRELWTLVTLAIDTRYIFYFTAPIYLPVLFVIEQRCRRNSLRGLEIDRFPTLVGHKPNITSSRRQPFNIKVLVGLSSSPPTSTFGLFGCGPLSLASSLLPLRACDGWILIARCRGTMVSLYVRTFAQCFRRPTRCHCPRRHYI